MTDRERVDALALPLSLFSLALLLHETRARAGERVKNKEKCSADGAHSLARERSRPCARPLSRSRRLLQLAPYCNMAACNDTARERAVTVLTTGMVARWLRGELFEQVMCGVEHAPARSLCREPLRFVQPRTPSWIFGFVFVFVFCLARRKPMWDGRVGLPTGTPLAAGSNSHATEVGRSGRKFDLRVKLGPSEKSLARQCRRRVR